MVNHPREKALSELIGFILLLALLILVASLYLTYVVPAHGREGEIAHMDYIKGQFLDYKISTDALWINREYNVPIAQAITLGTQGVKTAGMFAGFQLFTPVFSSGELSVHSTSPNEILTTNVENPLYSYSYVSQQGSSTYTPAIMNETVLPGTISVNQTPAHLYLNFSTSAMTRTDDVPIMRSYNAFPPEYGATFTGPDYYITLKAAPRYLTKDFNWTYQFLTPDMRSDYWVRFQTDLLLSIRKGDINILENYPVYSDIRNTTERTANYTIDLMDPAYGFSDKENDFSLVNAQKYNLSSLDTSNFVVGTSATSGYTDITAGSSQNTQVPIYPIDESGSPIQNRKMGRLEFRSHNVYYRTQQNFIYQLGGIFVNQTDGSSPLNLPLISVTQPDSRTLKVDITDISLSGDTAIAGSSPVQVQTTLRSLSNSPLDTSHPNAAFVVLTVKNTDNQDLWKLIFNAIKKNSGITDENIIRVESIPGTNTTSLIISGPTYTQNTTRDIQLTMNYVDFNVELDAVGKTTGI